MRARVTTRSLGEVISKSRRGSLGFGAAVASLTALAAPAWGDGPYGHGPEESAYTPLAVWLVGIGLTVLVAVLVVWQARRGGEYVRRVRGFSRNAVKVTAIRSPLTGRCARSKQAIRYD